MIPALRRCVPERHNCIADELVDGAATAPHCLGHRFEVEPERPRELVRREALRQRGETLEVGKEDRQFAQLATQRRFTVRRVELAHHVERRVLPHSPQRGLRLLEAVQHFMHVAARGLRRRRHAFQVVHACRCLADTSETAAQRQQGAAPTEQHEPDDHRAPDDMTGRVDLPSQVQSLGRI